MEQLERTMNLPHHTWSQPLLYCGWKKLNPFSQALNFVVRPLPVNNILYFFASHCILPHISVLYLAYIHLTSSISLGMKWAAGGFWFSLTSYLTSCPF